MIRHLPKFSRVALVALAWLALPAVASAHQLTSRYESPIPLAGYVAGAAIAVALSFALVIGRNVGDGAVVERPGARSVVVPRWLRLLLRAVGLVAWLLIVVQVLSGAPNGDADAGSLFVWLFGWVAVALVSALIFPIWRWLDPFTTLFDLGTAVMRRLGIRGASSLPYPTGLGLWPAVVGLVLVAWFELVVPQTRGGRPLGLVVIAYSGITLLLMSQFGRDAWRDRGETFSVWFGTLNRLAAIAPDPAAPDERVLVRRYASGLDVADWTIDRTVLVAVATASVIYDGLSQTQAFAGWFGTPGIGEATVLLLLFVGLLAAAAYAVARLVGPRSLGAGLVPIATGYLIAHYLTFLLFTSPRIVNVASDPLAVGGNLLGIPPFEPSADWLPPAVAWGIQLAAIVGGHIVGAVVGHRAALHEAAAPVSGGRRRGRQGREGRAPAVGVGTGAAIRDARVRQVPLAVLMVGLTSLTLWSLGQVIVQPPPETTGAAGAITASVGGPVQGP
ncbi:MAG TPA: hypothetical protein VFI28_04325 [Candidatus Limnocylindrales bacterium]|nr:hypothetical protein [Candidatus Limnocylindrales bacterium]